MTLDKQSRMVVISCTKPGCEWSTEDRDEALAAILAAELSNHTAVSHTPAAAVEENSDSAVKKSPAINRPKISVGGTEETWAIFLKKWELFKSGSKIPTTQINNHLFQCCVDSLGDDLLKGTSDIIAESEEALLAAIKKLAVQPVARGVRRTELMNMQQDNDESIRSFHAKVKGRAVTCSYVVSCGCTPSTKVDYTELVIKDVILNGLVDEDIKKEVLGADDLDGLTVERLVSRIEGKETARNALNKGTALSASISSFRKNNTETAVEEKKLKMEVKCGDCDTKIKAFVRGRQGKLLERKYCRECFLKFHKPTKKKEKEREHPEETASVMRIGGVKMRIDKKKDSTAICLDHHVFVPGSNCWKRSNSMPQPLVRLCLEVETEDYQQFDLAPPKIPVAFINGVADTGAQSCLMGTRIFYQCGFKKKDLIPVKCRMAAANREPLTILGAILVRLYAAEGKKNVHTGAMVYITPDTDKFYLSREVLGDMKIINDKFPVIPEEPIVSSVSSIPSTINLESASGVTSPPSTTATKIPPTGSYAPCGCRNRTKPPERPEKLPFECSESNVPRMRQWLLDRYSSSTFNKCSHQQLPLMEGPPISILIDPKAQPVMFNTPATIPIHWMEDVRMKLEEDVRLGVLERVPMGEKPTWCFRMVLARKPDGSPRRTVDLSPLNKFCYREPHHVQPPFQQAKSIPPNTYKTVLDAWNGYHSVPIREADRHLTTFITPFGRFRYRTAPQGFKASGDGYTRRYDEIISEVERKTKATDDTVLWDECMEDHWWRTIDYLDLVGRNGIIINPEKLQFAQKEVNFAGFHITADRVEPLPKFLAAIRDFPKPKNITDVRSWFGLINQCSHYGQLSKWMLPFKHLLSPKTKFLWCEKMDEAFDRSKELIIEAIKKGVEIFDPSRPTCLRTDWSITGLGFFLGQKHCDCAEVKIGCCDNGWRITLAGSRFLRPSETRFAPVEGESLGIVWALEQTKYFTLGCKTLLVATDHKPLIKLFGDRTLDEISNTRLFRLKQRALPWSFEVQHVPGKQNPFADAASRYPTNNDDEEDTVTITETLSGLRILDDHMNDEEEHLEVASAVMGLKQAQTVSWERVKAANQSDPKVRILSNYIRYGFPDQKYDLEENVQDYWQYRQDLSLSDGVILYKGRTVIPDILRLETLGALHAAHQGITSMTARAQDSIFWPGITLDIQRTRDLCDTCNRNAPSQPRMPPTEPTIPTMPFECIAADYFHLAGNYYLAIADRLSGWIEIQQIRSSSFTTGAAGLCAALRSLFCVFGVPAEISSDSGPEFKSYETKCFLERWGVKHRISSAYFAQSNGRAELGVKASKRLLRENIDPDGSLNTDKMVKALLIKRNTPEPGCRLSPAEVVFGRKLKDTLPYGGLQAGPAIYENKDIDKLWRNNWDLREQALKQRYMRSVEKLDKNSKLHMPLHIGDKVLVQNQTGRFATKWDKTGRVVDIHQHDQYSVKIDGSGRVSLRNRKFLRKMTEHNILGDRKQTPWPNNDQPCDIPTNNTGPMRLLEKTTTPTKPVGNPGLIDPLPSSSDVHPSQTEMVTSKPPDLPEMNEPEQLNHDLPGNQEEPSESPVSSRPQSSALQRELKRIGDYNVPGAQEGPPPPTRTRSGRPYNQ